MEPSTPALRALASAKLVFRVVKTDRPTSVEDSADQQGIAVGDLLRTLVLRRSDDDYIFVLVPGGRQIDWAKLRTHLGVRRLSLPDEAEAQAVTGYERGAITPFGSNRALPVVADERIAQLGTVAVGGGARGVNLHVDAQALLEYLSADVADIARDA